MQTRPVPKLSGGMFPDGRSPRRDPFSTALRSTTAPPLFPMHFFLLWSSSARAGANCNHGPSRAGTARDAVIEGVKVADRIPLPCAEIYDVVVAPAAVVGGLRRGFGANAQRVAARAATRCALAPNPRRRPPTTAAGGTTAS